jgi:hypothetical protein
MDNRDENIKTVTQRVLITNTDLLWAMNYKLRATRFRGA